MKGSLFSLGQRIRDLRMKRGMTQVELSKGICTPSLISQIESGRAKPSYKTLYGIAERLEVTLDHLLADVDLNLESLSTYKMAKAMLASKEYASAIPLLLELLEAPGGHVNSMDLMFHLGECYVFTLQLDAAERMFEKVRELAVLRHDLHLLLRVIKDIGLVEFYRKNYQLAAYQWQKALEMIEEEEAIDPFFHASLLYNLGLAYKNLGQIGEAVEQYRQAERLYEGSENLHEIGNVFLGLGESYRKLNNMELAVEYMQKATAIFESMENALMQLNIQVSVAALYAEIGREQEALPILEQAVKGYQNFNHREGEGTALVELANVHFRLGETAKTESLCERARILLPEFHVGQAWINLLFGKIALQQQQREQAIRCFEKAADCFKAQGEAGEWDNTMFEIARLHLEADDLLRAYGILEEMRRYSKQVCEERGIVL